MHTGCNANRSTKRKLGNKSAASTVAWALHSPSTSKQRDIERPQPVELMGGSLGRKGDERPSRACLPEQAEDNEHAEKGAENDCVLDRPLG